MKFSLNCIDDYLLHRLNFYQLILFFFPCCFHSAKIFAICWNDEIVVCCHRLLHCGNCAQKCHSVNGTSAKWMSKKETSEDNEMPVKKEKLKRKLRNFSLCVRWVVHNSNTFTKRRNIGKKMSKTCGRSNRWQKKTIILIK